MNTLKSHLNQVQNPFPDNYTQATLHNNITLEAIAYFMEEVATDLNPLVLGGLGKAYLIEKANEFRNKIISG